VERTAHFAFSYPPEKRPAVAQLLSEAEKTYREMAAEVGLVEDLSLKVVVAGGPDEFIDIQFGRAPPWAEGTAWPGRDLIFLRIAGGPGDPAARMAQIFRHELAHVMLHHRLRDRDPPRWLDEGYAMLRSAEWDFGRMSTIAQAVITGGLIPIKDLEAGFPGDAAGARLAYAESIEFLSFLISGYGMAGLSRLLDELAGGATTDEALRAVTGHRLPALERRWRKSLRLEYAWIPLLTASGTLWFLISVLFLAGYLRQRERRRAQLAEMARREELDALLDRSDRADDPEAREGPGSPGGYLN
jgi:hypothetical protein